MRTHALVILENSEMHTAPIPSASKWRLARAAAAAILLHFAAAAGSNAASINYGSIDGDTVMYTDVTESSVTDPVPLFGMPSVSGDSIDFTPVDFAAASQLHVPAVDQTDGHLVFGVMAHSGKTIKNINFDEGGGLTVGGFGTDATFVDVSAFGNLDIFQVDGIDITKLTIPIELTFSFGDNAGFNDNGTWRLASQGFVNGDWTGQQLIDIAGYLHTHGYPNAVGATKVQVSLDNKLYAQSEIESTASIDKKDFGGLSVTVNVPPVVPEPSAIALASLALLSSLGRRFSRRSRG
jgi:hypothetical protein